EALVGLRGLGAVVEQRAIFGGGLGTGEEVGAGEPGVGVGDGLFGKVAIGERAIVEGGGLEVAGGEGLFGLGFDLGGSLAESVAVGGVFGDAFAEVEEENAHFAVVFGIGDEQMDARPVEVGAGRGRADGDVDAGDFESGEELGEAVFEGGRHLGGV